MINFKNKNKYVETNGLNAKKRQSSIRENILVYIVVVTYNGDKYIEKCIEKITITIPQKQIVVIDNNSTDKTVQIIKQKFPHTHTILNKVNVGFGKANNIGMMYCMKMGAKYILLINQDAYLVDNCIQSLLRVAEKNKDFGIFSPMHLNRRGDELDYNFYYYINNSHKFWSKLYLNEPLPEIHEVDFVNAACWLIKSDCIKKVGGFSPSFFHYGEDEDYVNRLRYNGIKIGVCPSSKIIHDRNQNNQRDFYSRSIIFWTVRLSDINEPFKLNIKTFLVTITGNILNSISRCAFTTTKFNIKVLSETLNKLPHIISNRKKSEKIGAHINL